MRDDLDTLLQVLPLDLRTVLACHPRRAELVEVVLDVGRCPEARFVGHGAESLRAAEVTFDELLATEAALAAFGGDNRAGIPGTLHRISAIRNRMGRIVGLTCRVGRAVTGHVDMLRDILATRESVLFVGAPGVGKTTAIRDIARVLADELHRRVVVIDTSNEIGGDGDVPHPAIGSARRMQVPLIEAQHRLMIECVQNHTPQVVVVDEVGTEEEALACRTIAERGVQLIATAHGRYLADLMKNPVLSDLVGGIQSVTLGDDEARARGTQKSVLERARPVTFTSVVELRERTLWITHDTEESVDALLTGRTPTVEQRTRDPDTQRVVVQAVPYDGAGGPVSGRAGDDAGAPWGARLGDARDKDDGGGAGGRRGGAPGGGSTRQPAPPPRRR